VIIDKHIFTRGYATRENIAFYDHSWNKFLSYTNIQQISSISLISDMQNQSVLQSKQSKPRHTGLVVLLHQFYCIKNIIIISCEY